MDAIDTLLLLPLFSMQFLVADTSLRMQMYLAMPPILMHFFIQINAGLKFDKNFTHQGLDAD